MCVYYLLAFIERDRPKSGSLSRCWSVGSEVGGIRPHKGGPESMLQELKNMIRSKDVLRFWSPKVFSEVGCEPIAINRVMGPP